MAVFSSNFLLFVKNTTFFGRLSNILLWNNSDSFLTLD